MHPRHLVLYAIWAAFLVSLIGAAPIPAERLNRRRDSTREARNPTHLLVRRQPAKHKQPQPHSHHSNHAGPSGTQAHHGARAGPSRTGGGSAAHGNAHHHAGGPRDSGARLIPLTGAEHFHKGGNLRHAYSIPGKLHPANSKEQHSLLPHAANSDKVLQVMRKYRQDVPVSTGKTLWSQDDSGKPWSSKKTPQPSGHRIDNQGNMPPGQAANVQMQRNTEKRGKSVSVAGVIDHDGSGANHIDYVNGLAASARSGEMIHLTHPDFRPPQRRALRPRLHESVHQDADWDDDITASAASADESSEEDLLDDEE